jgi:hypothetical protein
LFVALALAACDTSSHAPSLAHDDFGDPIRIGAPPTRIVSLNPATTEILFALGADRVWPPQFDLWRFGKLVRISATSSSRMSSVRRASRPRDSTPVRTIARRRRFRAGVKHASLGTITSPFRRTVRMLGAILRDSAREAVKRLIFRRSAACALQQEPPAADGVLAHLGRAIDHNWLGQLHD